MSRQTCKLKDLPNMICCLHGPILVTAPHSITLPPVHRKVHLREYATGEIALRLFQQLCSIGVNGSIIVWNCAADDDSRRLDPNFVPTDSLNFSEWHLALNKWLLRADGCPLLHVDIHGKITDETFLDLGCAALEQMWPTRHQSFVTRMKCRFAKMFDEALMKCPVYGSRANLITVQVDPTLDGFRADGFATMSMQSAMLGIPSVQLELPFPLRKRLANDEHLCNLLARGIADVFQGTVVSWWSVERGFQTPVSSIISDHVEANKQQAGTQQSMIDQGDEEDIVFAMLSGMVERCHDLANQHDKTKEHPYCEDRHAFPMLGACGAGPPDVIESGLVEPAELQAWGAKLLEDMGQWERSFGRSMPLI
mmetsp:Transcript_62615/g.123754  ORF Transcript_62615/g.123754 Transcript_62615/m.123754 type:complete len:366 (-) Transcript_62615:167-1264(-)